MTPRGEGQDLRFAYLPRWGITMSCEKLTREDARILGLESTTIAGHTLKLMVLSPQEGSGGAPTLDALRERIGSRLDRAPRCRQRLKPTPLHLDTPAWVDDAEFDIAKHVRPGKAEAPLDRPGLQRLAANLMCERLDRSRPLWCVDRVDLDDGSVALIWRIHHCMADGITGLRLASMLLWDEPGEEEGDRGVWQPRPEPTNLELTRLAVGRRLRYAADDGRAVARELVSPRRWASSLRSAAGFPSAIMRELAPSASRSPLDRRIGSRRELAFASTTLAELKRIGAGFEAHITVNDVVLAATAGTLRGWLEREGAHSDHLRVKVPVSLHAHDPSGEALGNRDSFMFVDLPIAEPDPARRLLAINAETGDRKNRHDAETMDALLRDLGHLGGLDRVAQRWAMSPRVFSLSVSNVPGPKEPTSVLGSGLSELYFIAEVAELHALRISVVSAGGQVFFGLCADPEAVPDLQLIARGLEAEIDELAVLATAGAGGAERRDAAGSA